MDAETAQAAKVDFVGVLNGMTTREELIVYPHRQILDNLSLLPLIHNSPLRTRQTFSGKVLLFFLFSSKDSSLLQTVPSKTNKRKT